MLSLDGLARAVAARISSGLMTAALILLVWRRVKRTEGEITRLLARFAAGRLRVRTAPRVGLGGGGGGVTPASGRLPVRFGWLLPLVPCQAAGFASQIRATLAEPEMVALLQVSPQARRVLRPLCRMLAIEASMLGDVSVPAVVPGERAARAVRVRAARVPVEPERVPLPRGVLTAARRQGFGRR
jgi:hypothetical protein